MKETGLTRGKGRVKSRDGNEQPHLGRGAIGIRANSK